MLNSLLALFAVANLTIASYAEKPADYPTAKKHVKDPHQIVRLADGSYASRGPATLAKKPKPRKTIKRDPFAATWKAPSGPSHVLSYAASAYKRLPARVTNSAVGYVDVSQVILREARNNNLDPLILEIIIKNESNFDPSAVSGVGAQGLMQLMPETAADLGITNPFDPQQNVAAGARYFAEQYDAFGDVRLALAAYNAGPGNVQAYGGVPPFEETIGYVDRIAGEYEARKSRVN